MTSLAGEHGDLAAMMSIMRDQVPEEASDIRAEAFDAAVSF